MKYDSRKFIDLIRATTSKWANWDPPREIKVGDIGKINRQTGEFDWQGNIYDESFQERFGDSLDINLQHAHLQPVRLERTDDYIAVSSRGVSVKVVDLSVGVDAHAAANVKLQVNCQFTSKCGAALVLYKPQLSCLPRDEQLVRLLRKFHDALNGKYIVTEVISCPAYVMVMSTQENQNFYTSLDANVPVPSGIPVGGAAKACWTASAVHGIWRSGHHTLPIYCPLYKLKQPPPSLWQVISGRRNDTTQSSLIENWEDASPPWDPLDDEGEEDEIYDAALEGEELDWEN
ncbi:hypothetical protein EV363DRAFT_1348183 [Boletus edulis]|nr:hypothetical protein EV363DRAFT_1348183 [Boletus edulis]